MRTGRPPASGPSLPLDFSLLSFLIVDDQPFTRRLVRAILLGFGSREVYEAASGAEALELVRTAIPSIIITDLVMPMVDGGKFIAIMKAPDAPTNGIPIIVLSGYLTKTAALVMTSHGADELLVKPVSPKALYQHISRIVQRSRLAVPPAAFLPGQKRRGDPEREKARAVTLV